MKNKINRLAAVCLVLTMLAGCGRTIEATNSLPVATAETTAVTALAADTSSADESQAAAVTSAETAVTPLSDSSETDSKTTAASERPAVTVQETRPPVQTTIPETTEPPAPDPDDLSVPYSSAYALYRADDDMLIAGSGTDKRISLASITKLLSASVMLEHLSPDDLVTVGDEVYRAKPDSTLSGIAPNTTLTVRDLIAAMLLPSGNDAAYTAAVCTARAASGDTEMSVDASVEYFCGLMNSFAAEHGMTNSHFANPEGWDDPDHYTTLDDLLKLADYVLTVPAIRETAAMHTVYCTPVSGGSYFWTNTNLFLDPNSAYYRSDCIGLKTGTTADAGCCLVSAFDISGTTYVCAVMGCGENTDRYELMQKILNRYIR